VTYIPPITESVIVRTSIVFLFLAMVGRCLAQDDLEKLNGVWQVSSCIMNGKVQPKDKTSKEIIIVGNTLKGIGPEMTISIDSGKTPKWIDLTFKKMEKAYVVHAIFETNGDELKLCIPLAVVGVPFENKRPTRFNQKETGIYRATRVKQSN
jgi:uncharacterized protein (TIGR03067 family)